LGGLEQFDLFFLLGGVAANVPRQWANSLVVLSMVFRCFVSAFMGFLLVCGWLSTNGFKGDIL